MQRICMRTKCRLYTSDTKIDILAHFFSHPYAGEKETTNLHRPDEFPLTSPNLSHIDVSHWIFYTKLFM